MIQTMINFDDVIIKETIKEHNLNRPYIILIIGNFGSGNINSLFNLMKHQLDIDKIYWYAKNPYEAKHQLLINKRESTGLNHFNESKASIEYSNDMDVIYKNIEEYNPNKKRKILIVFDDMIANMLSNKKLNPIVPDLFIRGRKLSISLVFTIQSYFDVPKNIRLNCMHYFIMKTPNRQEPQQIAFRGEEILSSDQCRLIKQAKFTYSLLGKALKKQIKIIEDQREK